MSYPSGWFTGSVRSGSDEMNQIAAQPSAEQLREFINNELQNSDENQRKVQAANDFVALYKPRGYKDTKANAAQLQNALSLLGKTQPTVADFEDAYARLVTNGMLSLDEEKLNAMQREEERLRLQEILDNQFDEADA